MRSTDNIVDMWSRR